jgi:LPS-assembly protein
MWIAAFAVVLAMAEPVGPVEPPNDEIAIIQSDNPQTLEGDIMRVTGHVVVEYRDMRLEADWITYNKETRDLFAGDSIHFTRGPEDLRGDHFQMNLGTEVGSITNARGKVDPGFYLTASEAVRLPDKRYKLYDVKTTACEPDCESWLLRSKRMTFSPQKQQFTASNTIFRFRNVPLFYFPYFAAPTESRTRSSGFLIPSTGTSTTRGRSFKESFYWSINRSADAMVTGEYFTKRGPTVRLEFRARPDDDTAINVNTLFAGDRMGQGGRLTNIYAASNIQGFRSLLEMNVVSSLAFRQVYEDGFNQISSPIQRVQGFMERNGNRANVSLMFDNSTIFFQDEPNVTLRRLPSIQLGLPTRMVSGRIPIYMTVDAGITGYTRRDAAVQTPGTSGRFDLHTSFEIPVVSSDAVSFGARFGVRETAYSYALNGSEAPGPMNRLLGEFTSWWTGPRLERSFGDVRHVIEPIVEYRFVTGADRFRDLLVVDDVDLYANTSEVEYGIVNRLMSNRELFTWRLVQKVFFDRDFGGALLTGRRNAFAPLMDVTGFSFSDRSRRFSPLVSSLKIATFHHVSTDFLAEVDTEAHAFRNAGLLAGVDWGVFSTGLAYYYKRGTAFETTNHQARGGLRYGPPGKPGLIMAGSFSYDVQRALFQGGAMQVGYNGGCYSVNVQFEAFDVGARKETRIRFAFALKNIGSYGTLSPVERLY